MIANFVLIISMTGSPTDLQYVGNFVSCDVAHEYINIHHKGAKESRCILEEYMHLPKDFKKRIITLHDNCKLKRSCNE